jgi:hypothetical protein
MFLSAVKGVIYRAFGFKPTDLKNGGLALGRFDFWRANSESWSNFDRQGAMPPVVLIRNSGCRRKSLSGATLPRSGDNL